MKQHLRLYALTAHIKATPGPRLEEMRTHSIYAGCPASRVWTSAGTTQGKSVLLVENLAQALNMERISHYYISCGLVGDDTLELGMVFGGRLADTPEAKLSNARTATTSHFYGTRPYWEMEFHEMGEFVDAVNLHLRSDKMQSGSEGRTEFAVWEYRPFLIQTGEKVYKDQLHAFEKAAREHRALAKVGRALLKIGHLGDGKEGDEDAITRALWRLRGFALP